VLSVFRQHGDCLLRFGSRGPLVFEVIMLNCNAMYTDPAHPCP